jgi:hypothetical protein
VPSMPLAVRYLNHASVISYGLHIMMAYEFVDSTYICTDSQLVPGPNSTATCPYTEGRQVLDAFDFPDTISAAHTDLLILGIVTVLYRLFGYLLLRRYTITFSSIVKSIRTCDCCDRTAVRH